MAAVDPQNALGALAGASVGRRRRVVNGVATAGMVVALLVAFVPLAFVTYFLVSKGASIISANFLTDDIPRQYRKDGGGMGPAIVGTLVITGTAALLAIPLGVLGAIYLNEYGRQRPLARVIRTMADVMTGVPSIVMGLFIYVVWVVRTGEQSAFAGALALACLMLPIVIRTTEETLRLVPDELRQASLGLGAPRWRTIITVVLPAALSGITSGAMLAVARAAGETAPLIATAGLTFRANWRLTGQNTALSAQIFRNATQPFEGAQNRAWGAALTLVAIVFVLTLLARAVASRFTVASR
jgi:phosphate transport system permease protein